jgi:hypothetical protein
LVIAESLPKVVLEHSAVAESLPTIDLNRSACVESLPTIVLEHRQLSTDQKRFFAVKMKEAVSKQKMRRPLRYSLYLLQIIESDLIEKTQLNPINNFLP